MQRKFIQKVLLTICFMLLVALPAAAQEVSVNLNGQPATFVDAYMKNGITMIDVDSFAKLSGAKVDTTSDSLGVFKNDIDLFLEVDNTEARLGDNTVQLPLGPVKSNEKTYVPLRFLCELFGYDVSWDNAKAAIELKISETKNGMTPQEVLSKANEAAQKINTYSMDGSFTIDLDFSADGQQQMSMAGITTTMSSQIQNQPMEAYLIQTVELPYFLDQEDNKMIMETYMTEEKMYFKSPEQPWTVQDMPIPPEFWRQQQNIQANPLEATSQMSELGVILTFSDDVTVDDVEYYVVNAVLNTDTFREAYQQIMQQFIDSMASLNGDSTELEQIIEQILREVEVDYFYTSLINKETFLNDIVKLDMKLDFSISLPEIVESFTDEDISGMPETLEMRMRMTGEFKIKDAGEPFKAPDVKDAVPIHAD